MRATPWTVFVMLFAGCAGAAASTPDDSWRTTLHERGIDFSLGYLSETATNVRGGERELTRYADQWTLGTTLDLDRLLQIDHASFQITVTDRNGRNLSRDAHLSTVLEVQEIYGRGQTWHWTQFEYRQTFFDGRLDWKIGRLVGGEDFADFSCEFLNVTFCGQAPGNIAGNFWYTWPISQWATRLRIALGRSAYVQVGAFEANPRYLETRHALDLGDPGGATGMLVPIELGWQPVFGERSSGSYKVGVWYDTSRANDVADPARSHGGHFGAWLNLRQNFGDFSVFANAATGDRGTSHIDRQIMAGIFYTGTLRARPLDLLGFAIGRTHINDRARIDPSALPASERLAELFYSVHFASGFEIRPSVQYVHWQQTTNRDANTLVFGVRVSFSL